MQHLLRQLHLRDGSNCHPERREDMKNYVITIARGFGSGGKEIGNEVAKRLGIPCYEKRILKMASEFSGLNEKMFFDIDEKLRGSYLHKRIILSLSFSPYASSLKHINSVLSKIRFLLYLPSLLQTIIREVTRYCAGLMFSVCLHLFLLTRYLDYERALSNGQKTL